jgi:glycolate oxidase FAD binding subunit
VVLSPSPPLVPSQAPGPLLEPDRRDLPDLVRQLHEASLPWLPAGHTSRLHWGPPVQGTCTVVSARRLDRILEHNPGDFTVTVEAGTPLVQLQETLAAHGQWLALDPPWGTHGRDEASAGSLGGLVARGLAGGYRHRHLGVRDQLIGIRLLRSDGVTARAGGKVVKNVAGYDLMRLFTGSWGSLGLITELTLRTMPLPPQRRGLCLQGSLGALAGLVRWLLASSLSPERLDWWSPTLAAAAGFGREPLLLIALASVNTETLEEQIACLRGQAPGSAHVVDADALEALLAIGRGGTSPLGSPPEAGAAAGWLLRLGVNGDAVDRLLAAPELEGLAVEISGGSGLGMAWWSEGCGPASPPDPPRVEALRRLCGELGGHLTVLVQPPGSDLPAWLDAPSLPLIETLKRRFDPRLQLAPGRLPGVAVPRFTVSAAQAALTV